MIRIVRLFRYEQVSGLLIVAAIMAGLFAANSSLSAFYWAVHHAPVHIGVGLFAINEPLIKWINDGLMVFFFLSVGLEIKRELLEGHLATLRQTALPGFAALGGMILPATIYAGINWTDPAAIRGWAVPTATDIVLAVGLLSLLGSRVPVGLKVFLTALAIFDDIGAVLIIGLVYGEGISPMPSLLTVIALAVLYGLNVSAIMRPWAFVVVGLVLWVALQKAGIEAALAGVLIALAVPLRTSRVRQGSPIRVLERRLHPWVVLAIVPLFAFLNAGIRIDAGVTASLFQPVSVGIIAGLFIGKQLGVLGATVLAVRTGLGQLPGDVTWGQLYGAALLAGIGFTMSLFVASLAFSDAKTIAASKAAVLLGSLLSAISGLGVVYFTTMKHGQPAVHGLQSSKERS